MKGKIIPLLMLLIPVSVFAAKKTSAKIPTWALHKEVAYPSEIYITAEGEGENSEEAKVSALSQISLYFNTKTNIEKNLSRELSEKENEKENTYIEETSIKESANIKSEAEFYCVEFSEPYTDKNTIHILAVIERDKAYSVYKEKILQNVIIIKEKLAIANDKRNPVAGLKAAKESCEKAEQNAMLISNARIVKRLSKNTFSEEEKLLEKSYQALRECNSNMSFNIVVENDFKKTIETKLSKILEEEGFSVSQKESEAPQVIWARIESTLQTLPAGTFITLSIHIEAKSSLIENASPYFSYSRTMEKKGSRTEEDVYRRAYLQLEEELETSFKEEIERFYLGGNI